MRIAIVATPGSLPDHRPAPGTLDGDLLRARLSLDDAGFRVTDVDPSRDLAEQLDVLFDEVTASRLSIIDAGDAGPALFLFYASTSVALAANGELFLCLDPMNPGVGDALSDIAAVFRDRARGAVLFVVECHHAPTACTSAAVVEAAKQAVASHLTGIELLVAAHPLGASGVDTPSLFTRALVEQLDEAEPDRGLTAEAVFRRVRNDEQLAAAIPCFARVRGQGTFPLLIQRPGAGGAGLSSQPPAPPTSTAPPPSSAPAPPARSVRADEAEPVAALGSSAQEVGLPEDAARLAAQPPASSSGATSAGSQPSAAFGNGSATEGASLVAASGRAAASERQPERRLLARDVEASSSAPELDDTSPAIPSMILFGDVATTPVPGPDDPIAQYLAAGDTLAAACDLDGALTAFKKALALVGLAQRDARADVYLRIAQVKWRQERRREAIDGFEKALQLAPEHRPALEALIELNVAERDLRSLRTAEERLLSRIESDDDRFTHLVQFAERWEGLAKDDDRAIELLERARELRPDDPGALRGLERLYQSADMPQEAFAVRLRLAELIETPREQAKAFLELATSSMQGEARETLSEVTREQLGIELLDRALDADPTMLEPLAIIAALLAARQEWGELELAYRRMIERAARIPDKAVRSGLVRELSRRLGLLFRDHLEDPASALDAFERVLAERPDDLSGRLTAAELARSAGLPERAAVHLQAAAVLDPANVRVFHDLFDAFQKLRRPDQSFAAACVTMYLRAADERERFIFEEHRARGIPSPARALPPDAWELLRTADRDRALEAVLASVADAAIGARLAQRAIEGKRVHLDPNMRQDTQRSTVSVVRSFAWASHFLGVKPPSVYLRENAPLGLAAVMVEEPSVLVGGQVLRGRSLPELAFLTGGHLAYHVEPHRLLVFYPSIEELGACFLASVKLVRPEAQVPAALDEAVGALMPLIDERLSAKQRDALSRAVREFYAIGAPADLTHWAAAVERCAARAGYLLSGDLAVASTALARAELPGVLSAEEKMGDLLSFTVSDAFYALREALGLAIEP